MANQTVAQLPLSGVVSPPDLILITQYDPSDPTGYFSIAVPFSSFTSNIPISAVTGVQQVGALGNAFTAGTISYPVIEMVSSPSFNNITASGTSNSSIILSAGTNLYSIFQGIGGGGGSGTVTSVDGLGNIFTGGTATNPIIEIVASPTFLNGIFSGNLFSNTFSANTFSAGTINSGATNLYSIFQGIGSYQSAGTYVTLVSAQGNLSVGGTISNPIVLETANPSFNNITISGLSLVHSESATTFSASTINSGTTNLYNIFQPIGVGVQEVGGVGNIFTSGTINYPLINISASPSFLNATFSGTVLANAISGTSISGGTFYSGGTNLYQIFTTVGSSGASVNSVTAGANINTTGTVSNPIVNLNSSISINGITISGTGFANAFSSTTFSAGTINSGATNLYQIFEQIGQGVQEVGGVGNIFTSGTLNYPLVNISANPNFNNETLSGTLLSNAVSATTLSASTINSGTTNLYTIFQGVGSYQSAGTYVTLVSGQDNITIGGTVANPIVIGSANPSYNNITISGLSSVHSESATTFSASTINSGTTNLYQIFQPLGVGVQEVGGSGNITTAGTINYPIVGITANPVFNNSTFSGAVTANSVSATTFSASTINSGTTNLYQIFAQIGSVGGGGVQSVGSIGNITTGGTFSNPIIGITANPVFNNATFSGTVLANALSATTLSGGTIYSGGTNLYQIFATQGVSGVTSVNAGTNISIPNPNVPVVSTLSSLTIANLTMSGIQLANIISATTISATTISPRDIVQVLTNNTNVTWNVNQGWLATLSTSNLVGNVVLLITGATSGGQYTLAVTQGTSPGQGLTFNAANTVLVGGNGLGKVVLSSGASQTDVITFTAFGATPNLYCNYANTYS